MGRSTLECDKLGVGYEARLSIPLATRNMRLRDGHVRLVVALWSGSGTRRRRGTRERFGAVASGVVTRITLPEGRERSTSDLFSGRTVAMRVNELFSVEQHFLRCRCMA